MDSQLFFILENNVLTPIDQANICFIVTSEPVVPISDDNITSNPTEENFVASEDLICNYGDTITQFNGELSNFGLSNKDFTTSDDIICNYSEELIPLNKEELNTSSLSIPIENKSNEICLELNQFKASDRKVDETTIPDLPNIQNFYSCEHCAIEFSNLKLLNRHKRRHVCEKPFKCDHCQESFNFLVNLKVHRTVHQDGLNGGLKNECFVCNKTFRRYSSLCGHLKGHTVSEYFNCEHCDEIFLAKIFYDSHLKNYHNKNDDKEIKGAKVNNGGKVTSLDRDCKLCGKIFKKPSMLIRHMRVHNGEKPFKCNLCDRRFSQKKSLTTHMLRHTGKKPFPCTLCCRQFTQKGNLKVHKEKVHNKSSLNSDALKYPCNKCSCIFRKIGSLNRHITECHSEKDRKLKLDQTVMGKGEINFNQIFLQINDLKQTQVPDTEVPKYRDDNIIQLADRFENGFLIHRTAQQVINIDQGKKMLSCLNCGKLFTRPSDLLRHIRVHTKEKPYECYLCKRRFSVKRTLSLHYKIHESKLRKFSCRLCDKKFRDIITLQQHGTEYHQNCDNYLQCFPCKENFSNAEQLQTHSKLHVRQLSKKKDKKSYETSLQIQSSIAVKPETKNQDSRRRLYKCEECFKSFIKLCHLKQHQLSHRDDRPFKCNSCTKTFKSRNALTIHNRRHLNLKPYKCETCNENFFSKPILNRHKLTHSEVRNFKCPYCQKSFKSSSDCRKHIRIHQKEAAPLPIKSVVPEKSIEKAEMEPEQSNTRTCQYCNRYFKKPIDLRRHERIHTGERPFKCDKCEKSFSLASTLKFHQRIHDEVKLMYTCHVCSNKYATKGSLNVHKRIHTGERPYKCRYCEATFRTNGHCSVHESNHLKLSFERGIDPKDVKIIRSLKFESIVENFTFN